MPISTVTYNVLERCSLFKKKKKTYIQYRTKNFMYIMKTCTKSFVVEGVENFQTQETIADDTFLGPRNRTAKQRNILQAEFERLLT